jgi:hypothetical protein
MIFEFKFEYASMQGVPPYVQQISKQVISQFHTSHFRNREVERGKSFGGDAGLSVLPLWLVPW